MAVTVFHSLHAVTLHPANTYSWMDSTINGVTGTDNHGTSALEIYTTATQRALRNGCRGTPPPRIPANLYASCICLTGHLLNPHNHP